MLCSGQYPLALCHLMILGCLYICVYKLGCPAVALGKGRAGLTEQQHNLFAMPQTPLPSLFLLLHGLGLVYFLLPQLFSLQPSLYCSFLILSTSPFSKEEHSQPCCYRACRWHLPSSRAPTPGCRGC